MTNDEGNSSLSNVVKAESAAQPDNRESAPKKRKRRRKAKSRFNNKAEVVVHNNQSERSDGGEKPNSESNHDKVWANKKRLDTNSKANSDKNIDSIPSKTAVNKSRRPFFKGYRKSNNHLQRSSAKPAYAALDLGTNNCRLLIAVPNGHSFRVIDAFSRIVRLGEGIAHTGRLSDDAMDRAVDALKICASKLESRKIKDLRLVATEACRVAENGEAFIKRVREEAGLDLEIVTRETEAKLAVAGCASLIDKKADGVILFDIGGGSSELVWLDLKNRHTAKRRIVKRVRSWASLPVGVVNISERHGGVHVTPDIFEGMVDEVAGLLDNFPESEHLTRMVEKGYVHMLGTSGTVTTLAGVHLGLKHYDRRKVDGLWMSSNDVGIMTQHLLNMSFDDRSQNACIGADRADLVLAGCAILEALRRKWPCDRLRVADRGLREGILYELMSRDGAFRPQQVQKQRRKSRFRSKNKSESQKQSDT